MFGKKQNNAADDLIQEEMGSKQVLKAAAKPSFAMKPAMIKKGNISSTPSKNREDDDGGAFSPDPNDHPS